MEAGAIVHGPYRYRLWRRWADGARVVFVLLNPSTADAVVDDPTLGRCVGFARSWGMGGLDVVNLFAYRARNPAELRRVEDPVGPDNDRALELACEGADRVVLGWGNGGLLYGRGGDVWRRLGARECLGWTRRGQPRHPLYVPSSMPLQRAPPPVEPA